MINVPAVRVRVSRVNGNPLIKLLTNEGELLVSPFTVWDIEDGPDGVVVDIELSEWSVAG